MPSISNSLGGKKRKGSRKENLGGERMGGGHSYSLNIERGVITPKHSTSQLKEERGGNVNFNHTSSLLPRKVEGSSWLSLPSTSVFKRRGLRNQERGERGKGWSFFIPAKKGRECETVFWPRSPRLKRGEKTRSIGRGRRVMEANKGGEKERRLPHHSSKEAQEGRHHLYV